METKVVHIFSEFDSSWKKKKTQKQKKTPKKPNTWIRNQPKTCLLLSTKHFPCVKCRNGSVDLNSFQPRFESHTFPDFSKGAVRRIFWQFIRFIRKENTNMTSTNINQGLMDGSKPSSKWESFNFLKKLPFRSIYILSGHSTQRNRSLVPWVPRSRYRYLYRLVYIDVSRSLLDLRLDRFY